MSISYMNAVWECTDLKGSDLIAMLALANARNDKTGQCNPSIPTLAASVRVTERQIVRVLNGLEENGFLTISRGNGRGRSSHYEINIEKLRQKKGDIPVITNEEKVTPTSFFSEERVTSSAQKGDIQGKERVTSSAQKGDILGNPSIYKNQYEPKEEPEGEPAYAGDQSASAPTAPPSIPSVESVVEPELAPIDTTTLDLMKRWSKDKPRPIKVRLSSEQAKIVEAQPINDPPSRIQAATPLEPTPDAGYVISSKDGKIIIPGPEWAGMMTSMLSLLGYLELAESGVPWVRSEAGRVLEWLAKAWKIYRTKDGIDALAASWKKARPNTKSSPKSEWITSFAADFANGKVRYPDERKEVKRNVPDIRIAHADLTEYFANPANDFEITF